MPGSGGSGVRVWLEPLQIDSMMDQPNLGAQGGWYDFVEICQVCAAAGQRRAGRRDSLDQRLLGDLKQIARVRGEAERYPRQHMREQRDQRRIVREVGVQVANRVIRATQLAR